jgi:hypothetical protein
MARENQGLQIALIVFVMLTIILGVTTYLFFRQYEEADIKAKNNATERDKKATLAVKNEDDANELKRLIGVAKTEKVDAITTTIFSEDMKKFGGSYPEDVRFYRPLLEKMQKTINEKNVEVTKITAESESLKAKILALEASKQPQIDEFKQAAEKAGTDLADERSKFEKDVASVRQQETKLKGDLENVRKDSAAALSKVDAQIQAATIRNQKLVGINKNQSEKLEQLTSQKFDNPEGEIRWVNQRLGTVWINLGRADALTRQVTFSVYPANVSDAAATGGKKGSIEVTQILGDHLAEARLYDDKLSDPLMPGDKIFTPIWTPGEKRHFALAGLVDLDGSGKNSIRTVVDLITMNGGVVDSYVDEKGKKIGEITVNTRYLVLGEAPNEKGQSAAIKAFSELRGDADRLGVQKIQLSDLLERMGWKNQTAVVHYGRGSNPKDFAAKPDEGVQQKSIGNVTDIFQRRQPPAQQPSSAY